MIDVLLATYKPNMSYLKAQIGSIESQKGVEINLLRREDENGEGVCRNFAELLKGSRAEYTAFSDQDDVWMKEKLLREMKLLHEMEKKYGKETPLLVFSNAIVVDEELEYADFFWALPDRYPEIDFVFRPHPFLFKVMARTRKWSKTKVDEYIRSLLAKPNVFWSDGGDYFREFAESDGCIQDCGSFLVEYLYTDKPCCYMLKSPEDIDVKFAPLGKACLEQCYLAYDTEAIDRFVKEVVVGENDPKAAGRRAFKRGIAVNYPNAAEVALSHIKEAVLSGLDDAR